jgi:hypothetical protein
VLRYLLRFALLTIGFALTTLGLMTWQARGLSFDGLWPMDGPFAVHPLHLLVLGLAMIPPTLWEIFLLEQTSVTGPTVHTPKTDSDSEQ